MTTNQIPTFEIKDYKEVKKISQRNYLYESKDGKFVTIKQIDKRDYEAEYFFKNEINIMNILKGPNSTSFLGANSKSRDYFYIMMEYDNSVNLEKYLNRRSTFSIREIRYTLDELNKVFKIMNKENICHRNLKLSNILISSSNLTDLKVKLCDYSLSQQLAKENPLNSTQSSINSTFFDLSNKIIDRNKERQRSSFYCMAPETLKNNRFSLKSDIWSLGIIIYYMFHKEYPFDGEAYVDIYENIKDNKNTKLKSTGNEILDDLIKKMLTFEEKNRINWTQYFEHEFFKTDFSSSKFNLNCYNHPNSDCKYYCTNCRRNICPNCKNKCEKSDHRVIEMYKIGFTSNEEKEMDNLITEINNNIEELKQLKNNISKYFKKMMSNQENITAYGTDPNNNYKKFLMNNLKKIKENTVFEGVEKNLKKIIKLFPENFFETNFKHVSSIPRKTFILSIASFPSSKLVAVLDDKSIEVYDEKFLTLQSIPNAHTDLIRYVSVKDEEHFATCSNDSSIKTWIKIKEDFYKEDKVIPNAHEKSVRKVKYRKNNELISCSWDNSVKIWILKNGSYTNIKKLAHNDAINCFFVAEDINTLISSGVDGTKLWQLNDYTEIKHIQDTYCHGKNTLNRLDKDRFIIGGRKDGNIKVISVEKRDVVKDIDNGFQCFCICVTRDKKNFLIGGQQKTIIKVYSCSDYEFKYSVEDVHHDYVRGIINLNDGSIASYSDDKTIQIYKLIQ